MTTNQTGNPQRKLRLWPGIVIVALLLVSRFVVKAIVPGFPGFMFGMFGAFFFIGAFFIWWTFFSRAPRLERFGGMLLIIVSLGAGWLIRHESMFLPWLFAYALPFLCVGIFIWAVVSSRLTQGVRRITMVATILLFCLGWSLVRTEGINGDHVATFAWRWSPTAEERLLAQSTSDPTTSTPATQPAATPVSGAPVASPSPSPTASVAKDTTANPVASESRAEWPGFRGPRRDGSVRGIKIKTDWSAAPPVQLWRRPIGPGWSSFAVNGDLIYTQEQRGDHEVVACYKASSGEPVWSHRDAARFFESNAGAGPRGTPTLNGGRVYTFGATGILNALDAAKGTVIWTKDVAAATKTQVPMWGFASSPLVVGDVVIIAAAGQLVAYDLASGNQRWLGPSGGGSYSSPQIVTLGGVQQVLLVSEKGTTSVSPADGKKLWDYQWSGSSIVQPAFTADGDVLLGSQDNGTRRIAVAQGAGGWTVQERWTSSGLKPYFNDFVVHKGHAFGFDGRILSCIDLNDGQRKWKGGRYGNGQLVLLPDQDLLLVLSEEGELVLVGATPDQFNERAKLPAITGKTWNHPVLVGDILLVRNSEEMAAYRLTRGD
jgi:outer membrane protein assembly factor BamB